VTEEENGWKRRANEPMWDYLQVGEVVAIVGPEETVPLGVVAAPGTRWGVVIPNSSFELQSYPYATLKEAQREAERRLELDT